MSEKENVLSPEREKILRECEQKHAANLASEHEDPAVYYVAKPNSFVVFRAPRRSEIQQFKATAMDDKKSPAARADADWRLAQACVLWPTGADRTQLFERRPMLLTEVASEALSVASDAELKSSVKFESGS